METESFPLILSLMLSAVALITVFLAASGNRFAKISAGVASAGFGIGIVLLISQGLGHFSSLTASTPGALLASDWVSILFGVAVLSASFLVSLTATSYMKDSPNIATFYSLLLFTTIGAVLLVFSSDLLMMFVSWELMSIPSYVLTGFRKKDPESNEASVKYFIISAFASGVLLYGISLVYLLTGSTNIFAILSRASGDQPIALIALTFILAGFGIKLAAVPFHMWIPDAYQGAPTIVSSLLSAGTKLATFAPAARIFFILFSASMFQSDWRITFAVLAVLSMTVGNFAALTQKNITRILAYSSIGQAGYILIGFAAGGVYGLTGSFFQILNYAFMQSGAFLAAAVITSQTHSGDISSLDGIGKRLTIAPFAFTVSLLALGGLPPLSGFWSKLVLFYSAINSNLGWLAIIAIINSFVSIAFYARIVKHMYIDKQADTASLVESNGFKVALIIAAVVIVVVGVYPYPFIQFANTAASMFLAHG
ncbi:MAG: NADH-quinone oxidoreductase subunit N [Nitrososphaerota archaeon]|nr:NADH-quinone oxidoreductase subunit N [Nitrososphaerota archaeon]